MKIFKISILIVISLIITFGVAFPQIYQWIDKNGTVHISDDVTVDFPCNPDSKDLKYDEPIHVRYFECKTNTQTGANPIYYSALIFRPTNATKLPYPAKKTVKNLFEGFSLKMEKMIFRDVPIKDMYIGIISSYVFFAANIVIEEGVPGRIYGYAFIVNNKFHTWQVFGRTEVLKASMDSINKFLSSVNVYR